MENYIRPHTFKASSATLWKWLATRKDSIPFSDHHRRHPGIFSTSDIRRDKNMYRRALIGEFVGGAGIIFGGITSQNFLFIIISIVVVCIAIGIDVLASIALHKTQSLNKWY